MKKILLSVGLAFVSLASYGAAGITESNLTSVTGLRPNDRVRVNTLEGNSRLMTLSNFVNTLGTNGIAPLPPQYVFIGDSLTEPASQGNVGQDWPSRLLSKSNFAWRAASSLNLAQGATTAAGWVASLYDANVIPISPSVTKNTNAWLFVWLGVNDIVNSGTFANLTNNLTQLWQRGRTNGFRIAAFTIATNSNGTMDATENQNRTNCNVWMRTNSYLYDFLVDVDNLITNAVPGTGQTAYNDGIHFKAVEYDRLATFINTNFPVTLTPAQTYWNKVSPANRLNPDNITIRDAGYAEGGFRVGGGLLAGTFYSGVGAEYTFGWWDQGWMQCYNRDSNAWKMYNLRADQLNLYGVNRGVVVQDSAGNPTTNTTPAFRFWCEPLAQFNNGLNTAGTITIQNGLWVTNVSHFPGGARVEGNGTWPSGVGMEMLYDVSGGTIQTYDRSGGAWKDSYVKGLNVRLYPNNGAGIMFENSGAADQYVWTCTNNNGAGKWQLPYVLQEVRSVSNALFTCSSVTVFDDSTLSLPETTNILSVTITPKRSDTFIVVEGLVNFGSSAAALVAAGVFRDAAAAATSVHSTTVNAATQLGQIKLYTKFPSTSTAATTFNVRLGSSAGTQYINGVSAGRLFGGTSESWIAAREVSQ